MGGAEMLRSLLSACLEVSQYRKFAGDIGIIEEHGSPAELGCFSYPVDRHRTVKIGPRHSLGRIDIVVLDLSIIFFVCSWLLNTSSSCRLG